jgi:hypothetical protein
MKEFEAKHVPWAKKDVLQVGARAAGGELSGYDFYDR